MLEEIAPVLAMIATVTGILMTTSYFIQAYKIWKVKDVKEISFPFFSVIFVGTGIWLLYGLSISNIPLIASNGIGIFSVGLIIMLYFRYNKKVEK